METNADRPWQTQHQSGQTRHSIPERFVPPRPAIIPRSRACITPSLFPHSRGRILAAVAGLRRARHPGQRRLHGPGNWGTDLQGGAQFKYGLLWVVGLASLMAIFMQVIAARLGVVTGKDLAQCCRDWYPALDALAQLAVLRSGHRRLRPGRGARQRRGAEPDVPHPAALGGDHHRAGRAAAAGACSGSACGPSRPSCCCWSAPSRSATSSRFSSCRRPSRAFLEMGRALVTPELPRRRE